MSKEHPDFKKKDAGSTEQKNEQQETDLSLKSPADILPYNFEKGAEEAVSRITGILKRQPYAVVGFNATSVNVGKTKLSISIANKLFDQEGIHTRTYKTSEDIEYKSPVKGDTVFIFEQLVWGAFTEDSYDVMKQLYNKQVSTALRRRGFDVKGVDLWIGIFRPDAEFIKNSQSGAPMRPIADILIRNELAKDKK